MIDRVHIIHDWREAPTEDCKMDIVARLRFDAARCELQFSKGVARNIGEAADEIERLREENGALREGLRAH